MVAIITGRPKDYAVGTPPASGFHDDCREFTDLLHVTHAFRVPDILRAGSINARLVYDRSGLATSRTQVVWVSPNYWGNGFRYGTVALSFTWDELVRGRYAFWLEVAKYKIEACRILLADEPQPPIPGLVPYDPTIARGGPWWFDGSTNKHYFNSKYCLEFMIVGDVPLGAVNETTFVTHHSAWCSEYRTNQVKCAELGLLHQEAGARLVARLVGTGESAVPLKAHRDHVERAWRWLRLDLLSGPFAGTQKASDPSARALAVSALWLYATNRDKDARAVAEVFASEEDALNAARACVETGFGLEADSLK